MQEPRKVNHHIHEPIRVEFLGPKFKTKLSVLITQFLNKFQSFQQIYVCKENTMACIVAFLLLFCGVAIEFSIYPTVKCLEAKKIQKVPLIVTFKCRVVVERPRRRLRRSTPACCLHHHLLDFFESHWVLTQLPNPGIPHRRRHMVKQEICNESESTIKQGQCRVFKSIFFLSQQLDYFCRECTFCFKCISPHFQSLPLCLIAWRLGDQTVKTSVGVSGLDNLP